MDPMQKLSVQSIFGPKSRPALDKSKTRWGKDCFGYHKQRPSIIDEAAVYRVKEIQSSVNYWDYDRYSSVSPKNSLGACTQEVSLSDDDQREERLRAQKAELIRHAESLLSTNKSVVLCESEPDIVEEDQAEHFPEVTSIAKDNHGLELENDHPPRDAGNVPSLCATYPPKPAAGPAVRRTATLLLNFRVILRTALCYTTPTVSRCVLRRTLVTARTKLLRHRLGRTSPSRGW
jgi:hypothetical protein